jgi:hypothetical protein
VADDGRLIVSLERASMYTAALSAATRNHRLAYLVMPLDTIAGQLRSRPDDELYRITVVEQDATIAHNRALRFPNLISLDSLRRLSSFYFLLYTEESTPLMPELFSGFRACRADPRLLLFTASPGTAQTAESLASAAPCRPARS